MLLRALQKVSALAPVHILAAVLMGHGADYATWPVGISPTGHGKGPLATATVPPLPTEQMRLVASYSRLSAELRCSFPSAVPVAVIREATKQHVKDQSRSRNNSLFSDQDNDVQEMSLLHWAERSWCCLLPSELPLLPPSPAGHTQG